MLKSNVYIKDFKEGMDVRGFYLCKYVEQKTTRLGDEYLDLMLQDKTGSVRAKIWSFVDSYKDLVKRGFPVAVKGSIIIYNEEKEINIQHINNVKDSIYKKYGYNKNLLIKNIDININTLLTYLNKKINLINKEYNKVIILIIKKNIEEIKKYPSDIAPYNVSGGLLLEITDVLKLNDLVSAKLNINNFDESMIISSIILKKIGLINYCNNDLEFSINKEYDGIGITMLSIDIINKYFKSKKIKLDKLSIESIILNNNRKFIKYSRYLNSIYDLNISIK